MFRIRKAAAVAVLASVALIAAACGDDSDSSDSNDTAAATTGAAGATTSASDAAKTTAAPAFDPNGVLKVGDGLAAATGIEFDPIGANAYTSWAYSRAIYGSLLNRRPDGTYEPELATAWKVVDTQTVELDLRQGVTFQDGTPFNAEAVKFNLMRAKDVAAKSFSFSAEAKYLQDVTALGDNKVSLKFSEPVTGWLFSAGRPFFSSPETLMPSPAAIKAGTLASKPVGAGAFVFDHYTRDAELVLKKSPTYWNAANVKLAGIQFVKVAQGAAQVNGMRAGDIDIVNLPSNMLEQIKGASNVTVESKVTGNQFWALYLCKNIAPFNDVKVRQALALAIDRTALNNVIFKGNIEPATGVLPKQHRFYDKTLEGYNTYNVDRAKQLLAQAGVSNLTFTTMYGTTSVPGADLGEVIRVQLERAGITMKLQPVTNVVAQFFGVPGAANAVLTPGNDYGITDLTPGGIGNACQYNDPDLNALVAKIKAAAPESQTQKDLVNQYQKYILDQGLITWLIWDTEVFAYNTNRVGGVDYLLGLFPGPRQIYYDRLFIKK
ncbi:MAG: ABC transporter substrate-binding protein [Acidimicrobiia bacterium]